MEYLSALTALDWVILGLLFVAVVSGWVRGILRVLTGLLAFLLAVMIAGRLAGPLVDWVNRTTGLQGKIEANLVDRTSASTGALEPSLDAVAIPNLYKQPLVAEVARWSVEGGDAQAVQYAARQVAAGVTTAICFVLLVLVLMVVIRKLGGLFADQIQALPIVGTADRLLGAVAVGLEALVVVSLVLIWVLPTLSLYGLTWLGDAVDRSVTPPHILQAFEWMRRLILGGGIRLWNE